MFQLVEKRDLARFSLSSQTDYFSGTKISQLALPDSVLIRFQHKLERAQSEMQVNLFCRFSIDTAHSHQILSVFVTQPPDLRIEAARRRVKRMVGDFERALYAFGNKFVTRWTF